MRDSRRKSATQARGGDRKKGRGGRKGNKGGKEKEKEALEQFLKIPPDLVLLASTARHRGLRRAGHSARGRTGKRA